jgi:hypothetical protein
MADKFERDEDFTSLYANNVQFEGSAWDLKVIFGQLDQSRDPLVVEQHTAITMAWGQAKITAYYMAVNVILTQSQNGNIQIPALAIPARPDPTESSLDEASKRTVMYLAWIHDQFFGSSPYVPPGVETAAMPSAPAPEGSPQTTASPEPQS